MLDAFRGILTRDEVAGLRQTEFIGTLQLTDWRAHVPGAVMDLWDELGLEARAVAYIAAKECAEAVREELKENGVE